MILLWICIAVTTLVTVYLVLSPILRPAARRVVGGDPRAVYEDQLADLDRDVERGVVTKKEADALRVEISRRLLDAVDDVSDAAPADMTPAIQRRTSIVLAAALIGGSALLYVALGSPHLPGVPASERAAEREYVQNIERLAVMMKANPDDPTGWRLLATGYRSMGRLEEAAAAYEELVMRDAADADLLTDYGEVLILLNRGRVTERGKALFAAAVAENPDNRRARYYRALAIMQDGRLAEALAEFKSLEGLADGDATWLDGVKARISEIETMQQRGAGSATTEDIRNNPDILAMVEGLAVRLRDDPNDLPGWLRLIRSYAVLQETDLAQEARDSAAEAFRTDEAALSQINALADELGLTPRN